MKFAYYLPIPALQPYIKHLVITEEDREQIYTVFPGTGFVLGFQYRGEISTFTRDGENKLAKAGITGLSRQVKQFKNAAATGSVLVYFTDLGFSHFTRTPAHEIFNLSVALEDVFDRQSVQEVEDKLAHATNDEDRIHIVEDGLMSWLEDKEADRLIVRAVNLIYQQKGRVVIRDLQKELCISQSPFEKRFRKIVGTSPKKFASIVRFQHVLEDMKTAKSLADICYEHHFFDQAHFSKEFKQFTGESPEQFRR